MIPYRTIAFYKPYDVLSSFTDEEGRATLKHYIDIPGIYGAGRLDRDSEGLLLLSDDKRLLHRLTDPLHHLPKTYLVQVEGALQPREKQNLENGVRLEDGLTAPAIIKEMRLAPFNYSLIIHEGKKRQIRRMFAHLGYRVMALKRIRMGKLTLGTLKESQTRQLTEREIKSLQD